MKAWFPSTFPLAGVLLAACVLLVPGPVVPKARAATIAEIAAGNGSFSTLVAAAQAAGLIETLSGPGPLTVFAPTDEAFARLPEGTVTALLADLPRLRQILLYHVLPGAVPASSIIDGGRQVTVQGAAVRTTVTNGAVLINESRVVTPNIEASNGIIHVIDQVLLPPPTIAEIAAGNGSFSTLVAAAQAAGLIETLSGPGPLTVFAPTDEAFARLPEGTVTALLADLPRLRQILLYHVLPGAVPAASIVDGGRQVTVQGAAVRTTVTNGAVLINESRVITPNIEASNGIIHVIDQVLLPPPTIVERAIATPSLSTLVQALTAAGLVPELQKGRVFTVFAPTDEAFAALPAGLLTNLLANPQQLRQVLLYHLVRGRERAVDLETGRLLSVQGTALPTTVGEGQVTVGGSRVIAADIEASDGVIHLVDRVILPPPDVPTIAAASTNFTTLVTALQTAGLIETLQGAGPFTVFAPTDAAFAKLPAGLVASLLADTTRLRHILLTHVLHGPRVRAQDLREGQLVTLSGAPIRVSLTNGVVQLNGSRVADVDIEGFNGVIHVMDDVILPAPGFEGIEPVISVKGGTATVAWPDVLNATVLLESAASPTGPWGVVEDVPFVGDGVRKVTLPSAGVARFFRLRQ